MFVYSSYDNNTEDPKYTLEALVSAVSLRRHTEKSIALVTNNSTLADRIRDLDINPFTRIEIVSADTPPKAQKIECLSAAGEGDAIFVDSDTIILDDISRVFEFGEFDIAGAPAIWRESVTSISEAVRQEPMRQIALNSGLLFVRKDWKAPLTDAWSRAFSDAVSNIGPRAADQPPLTRALTDLQPRILRLPINYNYRTNFGGLISGKCFVVHGHFFPFARKIMRRNFDKALLETFFNRIESINNEMKTRNFPRQTDISITKFNPV